MAITKVGVPSSLIISRRVAHHVRISAGGGEACGREMVPIAAVVVPNAVGGTGVKLHVYAIGAVSAAICDWTPHAAVVILTKAVRA